MQGPGAEVPWLFTEQQDSHSAPAPLPACVSVSSLWPHLPLHKAGLSQIVSLVSASWELGAAVPGQLPEKHSCQWHCWVGRRGLGPCPPERGFPLPALVSPMSWVPSTDSPCVYHTQISAEHGSLGKAFPSLSCGTRSQDLAASPSSVHARIRPLVGLWRPLHCFVHGVR